MNQNLFDFNSYKSYLRFRTEKERGLLTRLAKAAHCQPAYLWRALKEEIHITPDHAFKITQFLGLSEHERAYFLTLVDWERSGDSEYKKFLYAKLQDARKQFHDLKNASQKPDSDELQKQFVYHSHWSIAAIHFFTSRKAGVSTSEIANSLGLSKKQIESALSWLLTNGYIKKESQRYFFAKGTGHINKTEGILPAFHERWRQQAVLDSFDRFTEGIHFTNLQMISRSDFQRLKSIVNACIREMAAIANKSVDEELLVVNLDLFLQSKID